MPICILYKGLKNIALYGRVGCIGGGWGVGAGGGDLKVLLGGKGSIRGFGLAVFFLNSRVIQSTKLCSLNYLREL